MHAHKPEPQDHDAGPAYPQRDEHQHLDGVFQVDGDDARSPFTAQPIDDLVRHALVVLEQHDPRVEPAGAEHQVIPDDPQQHEQQFHGIFTVSGTVSID